MVLITLMFAIWSSCFAIAKWTLQFAPPIFLTASRMGLAGILLIGFLFFKNRSQLKLSRKNLFSVFLLSLFSVYLTNILEFYGLTKISAAKTCFIYSLTPFFSAFFSYLHFKERMNLRKWIGLSIGFLAILPTIFSQFDAHGIFKEFAVFSLAEFAVVGATLFSVYGWILLRLLVKDDDLSPVTANGYSMLLGGAFALVHSFFIDSWLPTPVAQGLASNFMLGTASIIFISNVICYNLYGFLLKRYTATFLSFVGLLSPLFASFSEWVIFGTPPSMTILFSSLAVILGLYIVYREEIKQGYIKAKNAPAIEN